MESNGGVDIAMNSSCGVEQSDEEALINFMKAADEGHLVAIPLVAFETRCSTE
jgi:hypothetical protein